MSDMHVGRGARGILRVDEDFVPRKLRRYVHVLFEMIGPGIGEYRAGFCKKGGIVGFRFVFLSLIIGRLCALLPRVRFFI